MGMKPGEVRKQKFYTGLTMVEVIAINPTNKELKKLGIDRKDEIKYADKGDKGEKRLRIDVWVQLKEKGLILPVRFFLTEELSESRTGNKEWINDFGLSTYGHTIDEIKGRDNIDRWLELTTLRQAFVGETKLVDFLKNWLCIDNATVAKIDNWENMFNGDITEVKGLLGAEVEKGNPYKVQTLMYINDRGYQDIYSRFFGRMDSRDMRRWKNHFDGSTMNLNYGGDFAFKEWDDEVIPTNFSKAETLEPKKGKKNTVWAE